MSISGEIAFYLHLVQGDIEACSPPAETILDGKRQVPAIGQTLRL